MGGTNSSLGSSAVSDFSQGASFEGAQVMNTSQGKCSDLHSLEISSDQQVPTRACLSPCPDVELYYPHTIFDLFNAPEPLLDNEMFLHFIKENQEYKPTGRSKPPPFTLRFFSEEFK